MKEVSLFFSRVKYGPQLLKGKEKVWPHSCVVFYDHSFQRHYLPLAPPRLFGLKYDSSSGFLLDLIFGKSWATWEKREKETAEVVNLIF